MNVNVYHIYHCLRIMFYICTLSWLDDGIVARLRWDRCRAAASVILPSRVPQDLPLHGERHPVDARHLPSRGPFLELLRIRRRARRLPHRFHHRQGKRSLYETVPIISSH